VRELILQCRDLLRSTPDSICLERARLATEGYQRYEGEPVPLCRAKTFQHILDNMTLDLGTNPVFAGNTSSRPRAWMLLPEYGFVVPEQAVQEDESLAGFLDGQAIPDDLRAFWASRSVGGGAGVGHLAVDLARVLSEGLEGIMAEAESCAGDGDPESADYRKAMILSCDAVMRWAARYADAAREAAQRESDRGMKGILSRVADACRQVPAKPARNLFEALQAVVLVQLAIHIEGHGYSVSPGLLDRVLRPYCEDREETTELLAAFMLKLSANSLWGSHSKTQAITLGGLDARGADQCNPLTLRFLDACDLVRMPDPHVFIRWHDRINRRVKERAIELLGSGLSMPMLVGDEQTARGLMQAGVAADDAWSYCVIGCNELGIPGKLADSAVGPLLNDVAVLNEALVGIQEPDSVRDMNDLMRIMRNRLKTHLAQRLRNQMNRRANMGERAPTPFTSSLMGGCVRRGCDLHSGMVYSLPSLVERGFTNLVNGLAALEEVVFDKRHLSLGELIAALRNNFADPCVRSGLLDAPKWGNDDDRADKWALAWMEMRDQVRLEVEEELGDRRHLSSHVVRSLHHIDGRQLGASPDGRLAGSPLCDSIGAPGGISPEGPTALLNSVIKLDPAIHWPGGYNLNLTIAKGTASDESSRRNLIAMMDAFFADGGQELQINCLDASMLRDAKDHPERYADLLVRIAGFNALFARLSAEEQEELIARAEMLD